MKLTRIGSLLVLWLGAACEVQAKPLTRSFVYATPDRCRVNGDIWFCGPHNTVTLIGDSEAHDFSLIIQGDLEPQIKMAGSEVLVAKVKSEWAYDQTVIVHRISPGDRGYTIYESLDITNSRFALKDVTDVCLQAEANFAPATRC